MARVSISLSKEREAAIEASGRTLLEIIDLGLEAASGGKVVVGGGDATNDRLERARFRKSDCKHPPARRAKGLCMACGTYVG